MHGGAQIGMLPTLDAIAALSAQLIYSPRDYAVGAPALRAHRSVLGLRGTSVEEHSESDLPDLSHQDLRSYQDR